MYDEMLEALFAGPKPDWKRVYSFMCNQKQASLAVRLVWLESHNPELFEKTICELVD